MAQGQIPTHCLAMNPLSGKNGFLSKSPLEEGVQENMFIFSFIM